jgi:predicted nucleotidyltransferase
MRIANMVTPEYLGLLKSKQISQEYRCCLAKLVDGIIADNPRNIETILLYGGIVREGKSLDGWSDIDIVVVFKDITKRDTVKLAALLHKLEKQYCTRVDLTQVSLSELKDLTLLRYCANSELINALSMRKGVSILVFGQLPYFNVHTDQEKQAAIFYITNTVSIFRRYVVEVLYRGESDEHIKAGLIRITRWVFSIVRASLRLFDVYTHPYEYCLPYMNQLFPEEDFSLLERLIQIRENIDSVNIAVMRDMIPQVESFVEKYTRLALRRYANEAKGHK